MTKIDDAMIERASAVFCMQTTYPIRKEIARAMLEAALQPPEEIPVSEGMIKAGAVAWNESCGTDYFGVPPTDDEKETLTSFYRAMESARRAEASENTWGNDRLKPRCLPGKIHYRKEDNVPGGVLRVHRRKGDPK